MSRISNPRGLLLIGTSALALFALVGAYGCAVDEPPTIEAPEPAPPAENDTIVPDTDTELALVESKCSQCHTLDRVWAASMDRSQWETTVSRMEANGLVVSDDERTRIIDYLSER